MVDVHEPSIRSYNMSRIKGADTKPEMLVRKFLFSHGFRYRVHDKRLIGKPDIVLSRYSTIIDIKGCFWHGHDECKFAYNTKSAEITKKIESAKQRDKRNLEAWKNGGWHVIEVWGSCELEEKKKESHIRDQRLMKIKVELESRESHSSN